MKLKFVCSRRCRLDVFLRENLPQKAGGGEVSNSKIRRLIIAGTVNVNAVQIRRPAFEIAAGSSVSVFFDENKFFYEKQPDDIAFDVCCRDVLFEDEYIIAVNKPSRFPTEETIVGKDARDNLHQAVIRWLWSENPALRNPPYAGIMHRLDRETSGVILFTKSRQVNAAVHDMFEKHTVRKIYRAVAVCSGNISPADDFHADNFIGRISPKTSAAKWGVLPEKRGGLHAHTDFSVAGTDEINGLKVLKIEARPLTGRTHQIRVHLAALGMPILGDTLYGAPPFGRIMLHAQKLIFPHPVTGRVITVEAALPEGF